MLEPIKKVEDNPCYNCPNRTVECHSTCVLYRKWKKEWEDYKSSAARIKKTEFEIQDNRKIKVEKAIKARRLP